MSFNKEIAAATTTLAPSNSKNTDRADEILPSTNAHIAINAAFADLPSHGGHIVILDGTVNIGGTILPVSNSWLSGMGTATKIMSQDGTFDMLTVGPTGDIEKVLINNLYFDGHKPGTTGKCCVKCLNADHVTFRNLYIENAPAIGLDVGWVSGPSQHVIMENITAANCIWSGVAVTSGKHIAMNNIHVFNNGLGQNLGGIDIETNPGLNDVIDDIRMSNVNSHGNDKGIQVMFQPADFAQQRGILIKDSYCYNNMYGIQIGNANYTTIDNCFIYENTQDGIWIVHNAPQTIISNCQIFQNTYSGIFANFTTDFAYGGFRNSKIHDCVLYNNARSGIHLHGTVGTPLARFRIENNIIHDNGEWGLRLLHIENADIINNTVYDNTTAEMSLAEYNNIRYFVPVSEVFLDLKEAHNGYVMNPVLGTGSEQTITGASVRMPDVTRNITITTSYGGSPSGDVVIEGTNAQSEEISETITIGGANTMVAGIKAFANCTKVIIPAGLTAPSYLQVGIGEKIGLVRPFWKNTDVYKIKKNYLENQTPGTVNVTYGTVDCTTITAHDELTLWYRANLNKFG